MLCLISFLNGRDDTTTRDEKISRASIGHAGSGLCGFSGYSVSHAALPVMQYLREQQFARKMESIGGSVEFGNCPPGWMPIRIQFAFFDRVRAVDLTGKEMSPDILSGIRSLSDLRRLNLSRTEITDEGLTNLKKLTDLEFLGLRETQISDVGLRHLKGLEKLQRLVLGNTQIMGSGFESLNALTKPV